MVPAPKGWHKVEPMANGLLGDTFFIYKTPLEGQSILTPEQILNTVSEKHGLEIGLWINMNNTDKYYPNLRQDVQAEGVEYVDFPYPGKTTPNQAKREEFNKLCKNFLQKNPDKVIGIHSTNGYNRPGFFACAFLILERKFTYEEAVEGFKDVRSPGIDDEYLHRALKTVLTWVDPDHAPVPPSEENL